MLSYIRALAMVTGFLVVGGAATAAPYSIDPKRGEVRFSYSMTLSSGIGHFTSLTGKADVDDASLANAKVDTLIDTRTLRAANSLAQGQLRGADFFDVARYPKMTFKSRSVRPKTATTGEMTGDLTIKGVTRPINLNVTLQLPAVDGSRQFRATTRIDRNDFNMTAYAFLVGAEVDIEIRATLVPAR